ncbi:cell wall hydrolase [Amaricoccus sp.]|uniref:cell wall hydrolase n=1 Tax=Amaricoccus sp. TaxID=1872485 RepID=UPI0026371794|nr:cell wall hydrolase [Amaricoccus sp.]HRO11180.1 cell wall hydrolase [Amaricoccus sp.]
MKTTLRRLARLAALSLLLPAPAILPASAGSARIEATRALTQEQSALDSASQRLAALTESLRPRARADEIVATSPEASSAGPLDFRTLDAMPAASGDEAWQCLAEAIYFEARGEPLEGQVAVAEVVLNRVSDRRFPRTVCGVTKQGAGSGKGCQFSYACDGNSDVMKSALARSRAEKLAAMMLAGRARTVTDGATYFHTRSVRPSWSSRMVRTASIGHHLFYRSGTEVAAAD